MVLAMDKEKVIGFLLLIFDNENLIIDLIGVSSDSRGLGVGCALISHAEQS